MPGTFIIRPIEANLTHNTDLLTKMSPYCSVTVANNRVDGQICKKGGKHPQWNDTITLPVTNESQVLVELMDKDKITHDDNIGSFMLNLNEVQSSGQVSKWYPLTYKNKPAGEILMEVVFQNGAGMTGMNAGFGQEQAQFGAISGHQHHHHHEHVVNASADVSTHSNVWTEQRQVVENHTFVKEVEVVETRAAMKNIEVMEPVKVVKDVQYTQAVPVKKQIEVVEPQVVMKEVEVIEPKLVTKTIQVVENVPVKRQVEVIEMRNTVQEVETFEPQTFTKQVEVTEYVPVKKMVEVTQPVTLKKAVEFVEPVITTQYITKELQQPVIINQEITTTVGPASVVGMSREYGYVEKFGEMTISEQQRLSGLKRWVGYETIFGGLNEQERFYEQQRLSRLSEEQWLQERARLMAFNEQQRLMEQRRFFSQFQQTGGFSTYTKTTETTTKQGGAGVYNHNSNF